MDLRELRWRGIDYINLTQEQGNEIYGYIKCFENVSFKLSASFLLKKDSSP